MAELAGWNLVEEKYARMMEFTHPESYLSFASDLPKRSGEHHAQQEKILVIELCWAEEAQQCYPALAGRGRPLRTVDDSETDTSTETYLRGELGIYSDETISLYEEMVIRRQAKGENRVLENLTAMVSLYGYSSLEQAEAALVEPLS